MKKALALSLCALFAISATGCFREKKISSNELSKSYKRTASTTLPVRDVFTGGMGDFAFTLFKNTLTKEGTVKPNELISPISAAMCLGLLNNGARGNTQAQINSLFGMNTAQFNQGFYEYTSSLYSGKNCRVEVANSVWLKDNALNVEPDFLQANADWYGAQAYASPFDETTLEDINNWCYNHTHGKIKKVLNEIPPLAVMYLINTLDFDAKWAYPYEREAIEQGVFFNQNGSTADVNMLFSEESFYIEDENAIGFTRPYKESKYSFMAMLPNEGVDLYEYMNSLNGEKWRELWANGEYRSVHARIPEFTYETEKVLNETLYNMGVTDMFSPDTADFSGIDKTQPLYCALVKQKSIIELDREGTKAASVTLAGMKCMSADPSAAVYITLDRPFFYAIVDNEYKLPLFLGAVVNL
ncbi:MAG: serpin family protein [Clostridia bacterium]|nr:serpin family protein [Clostridia bacterium]